MPEVTLVNPPSPFLINQRVFFPLSLLYISAYLKNFGYDSKIVDLAGKKYIPKIDADIIAFTSVTPQYHYTLEILKELKNRGIDALFVIGGPHATCSPDDTAKDFNVTVIGEGEQLMLRIVDTFPRGRYPKFFQGGQISNLDDVPFPDRDAIDIHRYKYFIDGEPATNMMTARGCPYNCAFCCNIFGKKIRFRSAKNVISELKELQDKYDYRAVMIYDDEFFINKKRDLEICRYFKKQKMIWRCFTRSNLVDEKLIKKASESGLYEILLGIESGSDRILQNINKGTTVKMNKKAIGTIRKYNIRVKLAMILGLPGETKESIQETKNFLESIEFDDIDFSILQVYPNTEIYKNPNKYDIIFEPGSYFKGKPGHYSECSPISTSSLTFGEILEARKQFEKQFKRW